MTDEPTKQPLPDLPDSTIVRSRFRQVSLLELFLGCCWLGVITGTAILGLKYLPIVIVTGLVVFNWLGTLEFIQSRRRRKILLSVGIGLFLTAMLLPTFYSLLIPDNTQPLPIPGIVPAIWYTFVGILMGITFLCQTYFTVMNHLLPFNVILEKSEITWWNALSQFSFLTPIAIANLIMLLAPIGLIDRYKTFRRGWTALLTVCLAGVCGVFLCIVDIGIQTGIGFHFWWIGLAIAAISNRIGWTTVVAFTVWLLLVLSIAHFNQP